jgi:hypothetical protein
MADDPCTVHNLRARWQPAKERLAAGRANHPTSIRMHRALSWLEASQSEGQVPDAVLVFQWIAFNALYGCWDSARREPMPDGECFRSFTARLLSLDADGRLSAMLVEHRSRVIEILDDEYVSAYFWQDPSDRQASRSKRARHEAKTWYIERHWGMVLGRLIERIYLLRCQLVHGAATFGGKLNRQSLGRCTRMMSLLMNAALLVVIDHGADEDWGEMCYPPLSGHSVVGDHTRR